MSKKDWKKARRFREIEEKYKPGLVLDSGRVVSNAPRDALDARARGAEKRWLEENGLDEKLRRRL
jgi:hypothetical protein